MSRLSHAEIHMVHRIGWLRAAVLGANDGLVSTASLVVAVTTLVALSVLGGLGASVGGAGIVEGAIRVTFWGALAMGATAGVGMIFGIAT